MKFLLVVFLGLILIGELSLGSTAHAQWSFVQALGVRDRSGLTGAKANTWTADQPNMSYSLINSPMGVCTSLQPPCQDPEGFLETGWLIEANLREQSPDNVLNQYSSFQPVGCPSCYMEKLYLDQMELEDNSIYTFTVLSQPNKERWVIKRDGIKVWEWSYDAVGFSAARLIACGVEAQNYLTVAAQCSEMQKHYLGEWSYWQHNYKQLYPPDEYCVYIPFSHALIGWGPC